MFGGRGSNWGMSLFVSERGIISYRGTTFFIRIIARGMPLSVTILMRRGLLCCRISLCTMYPCLVSWHGCIRVPTWQDHCFRQLLLLFRRLLQSIQRTYTAGFIGIPSMHRPLLHHAMPILTMNHALLGVNIVSLQAVCEVLHDFSRAVKGLVNWKSYTYRDTSKLYVVCIHVTFYTMCIFTILFTQTITL